MGDKLERLKNISASIGSTLAANTLAVVPLTMGPQSGKGKTKKCFGNVNFNTTDLPFGTPMAYSPLHKKIYVNTKNIHKLSDKEIGFLNHEFGHKKIYENLYRKAWPAVSLLRNAGMCTPIIAPIAISGAKDQDSLKKRTAISASLASPLIFDEISASVLGAKRILKRKGKKGIGISAKGFLGIPSYLSLTAVPIGVSYLMKKRELNKKQHAENTPI